MYLDMHSHSVSSDDSRATVEQYLKWIQVLRKRGHVVDGIVLTEHRKFDYDKDYSALANQYDVVVLKGSELDTRYGHVLVYGVTEPLTKDIDFGNVAMDTRELQSSPPTWSLCGSCPSRTFRHRAYRVHPARGNL